VNNKTRHGLLMIKQKYYKIVERWMDASRRWNVVFCILKEKTELCVVKKLEGPYQIVNDGIWLLH
jgi:hypothetical protein